MRFFLTLVLLQIFYGNVKSEPFGNDFTDHFLIFNRERNAYLINPEKNLNVNILNFIIDSKERNNTLEIYNPEDFSVFVDSKFYNNTRGEDTIRIQNSKILGSKDQVLVTIYSSVILNRLKVFSKANKNSENVNLGLFQPTFSQVKNEKNEMINRYIFGLIIVLVSLAVLKLNIPEIGKYVSNIISLGNFNSRDVFQRKDGAVIVIFILILFTAMIFIFTPSLRGDVKFLNAMNTYKISVILIYMVSLAFFNILFHNLFAALFKISKLTRMYTIELLFIVMILIMLFIPFYMVIFTPFLVPYILSGNIFDYAVWIFSIFLIINEVYFFYGKHRVRKIYIISYICICNIIPFIISYKIVKDFHIA